MTEWTAETRALVDEARAMVARGNFAIDIGSPDYRRMIERLASHIDRLEARVGFLVGVLTRLRKLLERTDISDHGLASTAYAMLRTIPARALSPSPEPEGR